MSVRRRIEVRPSLLGRRSGNAGGRGFAVTELAAAGAPGSQSRKSKRATSVLPVLFREIPAAQGRLALVTERGRRRAGQCLENA
jgi:hypothetical protein